MILIFVTTDTLKISDVTNQYLNAVINRMMCKYSSCFITHESTYVLLK